MLAFKSTHRTKCQLPKTRTESNEGGNAGPRSKALHARDGVCRAIRDETATLRSGPVFTPGSTGSALKPRTESTTSPREINTEPNVSIPKRAQNLTKEGIRGRGVKRYTPGMACVERSGTRQRLYAAAPYSLLTAPVPLLKLRTRASSILMAPISRSTDEKKPAFSSRFLQIWSAREDSNLRPTGPKPVALPSCATRRWGRILLLPPESVNPFSVKSARSPGKQTAPQKALPLNTFQKTLTTL